MRHVLFVQGAGTGAYEEDRALVVALQRALGSDYHVHYPRLPREDDAEYSAWKARIESELANMDGPINLVGHSVGGSVLLRFLSEQRIEQPVAGLFVIAAPYWGADDFWKWDEVRLPDGAAARLAYVPRLYLYHSRDDDTVPFAHLALYAARLPAAIVREVDGRGHQFGPDLDDVASDIKMTQHSPR